MSRGERRSVQAPRPEIHQIWEQDMKPFKNDYGQITCLYEMGYFLLWIINENSVTPSYSG